MTESQTTPETAATDTETAGAVLRRAREAAGLHVAALAVALKVPVAKLEALEADRLGDLPDAVFVRALASRVCRHLRVDSAQVLSLLPQTPVPRLVPDDAGLNTPFRPSHQRWIPMVPAQWGHPLMWTVPLLVAGALAIYFWPEASVAPSIGSVAESAAQVQPPVAEPGAQPSRAPAAASESAPAASPVSVSVSAASSQAVSPVASPSGVASAVSASAPLPSMPSLPSGAVASRSAADKPVAGPSLQPAAVATSSAAAAVAASSGEAPKAAPAGAGALVFHATEAAWVKVTDARGQLVFQKTLAAGEGATVSGAPPLSVVVGNVRGTQVSVRGAAFDVNAVARDNVARFTVE